MLQNTPSKSSNYTKGVWGKDSTNRINYSVCKGAFRQRGVYTHALRFCCKTCTSKSPIEGSKNLQDNNKTSEKRNQLETNETTTRTRKIENTERM